MEDKPSYLYVALSFVVVGIVWGGTNPLLKRGETTSRTRRRLLVSHTVGPPGSEAADAKVAGTGVWSTLRQLLVTLSNWRSATAFGAFCAVPK